MNKRQALEVLDQATSVAPLNRGDHMQTLEALKVMRDLVEESEAAEEAKKAKTPKSE